MTRMPILSDAPPLLADANARYAGRRWTPLRVFAWTFLFATLFLWAAALPGVGAVGNTVQAVAKQRLADRSSTGHRALANPGRPPYPLRVTGE
jgi:hypothetical protein